jgi:phosphoenolpyruvate carboxykinase (ATP)
MLKARLLRHGSTCWLVNTGWTGGPFGVGKRISIRHTRALLNAALNGKLASVQFREDPVFQFEVPVECESVPAQILDPAAAWPNREAYAQKYATLAARFVQNFQLIRDECPAEVPGGGPRVVTSGV